MKMILILFNLILFILIRNLFNDYNTDWTAIYILPPLVTYNTYMQSFQYKILNNVPFVNEKLHTIVLFVTCRNTFSQVL